MGQKKKKKEAETAAAVCRAILSPRVPWMLFFPKVTDKGLFLPLLFYEYFLTSPKNSDSA